MHTEIFFLKNYLSKFLIEWKIIEKKCPIPIFSCPEINVCKFWMIRLTFSLNSLINRLRLQDSNFHNSSKIEIEVRYKSQRDKRNKINLKCMIVIIQWLKFRRMIFKKKVFHLLFIPLKLIRQYTQMKCLHFGVLEKKPWKISHRNICIGKKKKKQIYFILFHMN